MAGGGSGGNGGDENPVPVNATALIDVIFCLIIFFMASFHLKQVDKKMEAWLPKEHGVHPHPAAEVLLDDIRVLLAVDDRTGAVETRFGARLVEDDPELVSLIAASREEFLSLGKPRVPVVIDAATLVPWRAVVHVLDLCALHDLGPVELAGAMVARR